VSLTPAGELVVNYARRLLTINDQILDIAGPKPAAKIIRIGATGDFTASGIALGLTPARLRRPDLRYEVYFASLDELLRDLREGGTDLAVGVSATCPIDTPHYWTEPLVWVHSDRTHLEPGRPIPLVAYRESGLFTRCAINALVQVGRECELVFLSPSIQSMGAAISMGIGIMALPRYRLASVGIRIWEDAPLPKLPDVFFGVYARPGGDADADEREQLAASIANALNPALAGGSPLPSKSERSTT